MPRDDTPYVFSVSPYASSVARDMYAGQLGQNDQQDAMRHMLAAGTLARKYNPTIAELLGKAHEYSTSPLAALRFMLGRGQMPLDYEQDIHNNALGIELGQKAKTQLELEKLVLEAAEQAANQRTSGRAWIGAVQDDTTKTKYAKGGAVHMGIGGLLKLKNAVKGAQKVLRKAPQEDALRLAQQRAALPRDLNGLGLPADNTPQQRAKAMGGKDMVHFSRAGGDYTTLDSGKFAIAPFDAVGTHVGTPEAAMERYQNTVGYKVNNPNYANDELKGVTYPVTILGDRPMMNQKGLPFGEDELNAFLRQQGGHNWSDTQGGKMTYQDMNAELRKKLFEEQGYTSIPYYNEVEGKGSISYIVPPDNIRSRNAAFDPFRRDAATAAAMGVLAPDLMAEENKKADGGGVHFDEGGAAFGVFPQMKPRRAQQDRTAAANAPLSALRGYAAGTAGLPGDIEGLARAGISQLPPQLLTAFPALRAFGIGSRADPTPQLPTTEFYNEYLPGAQLNETPTGKAFTTAGNLLGGTGSTTLARYGIKSAKAAGQALGPTAVRIGEKYLERQGLMPGVIKAPGGNFLKGDIEDAVRPMKMQPPAISGEILDNVAGTQLFDDYRKFYDAGNSNVGLRQWTEENHPDIYKQLIGKQGAALNNFIDKKIAPYIRNEMATPDDPLRAMAEKYDVDKPVKLAEVQARIDAFAAKMEQEAKERGVPVEMLTSMRQQMIGLEKEKALVEAREGLHFTPDEQRYQYTPTVNNRQKAGMPIGGMGRSPLARSWENVTDSAFNIDTADKWLNYKGKYPETALTLNSENPWLAKVPPETKVYSPSGTLIDRTGFDHLLDELHNATIAHGKQKELDSWLKLAKTPEEVAAARQAFVPSLPANLHIDPADLGKLTMPQAVDRVADINAWRATQKIEANQAIANNAATQVVKEYPEQGLKWVELSNSKHSMDKLPEGWSLQEFEGSSPGSKIFGVVDSKGHLHPEAAGKQPATPEIAYENFKKGFGVKELEAALKYEGDTMKHCVGGYCPDVLEGRSRIYSLRDSKGQPRVTIEVKPHEGWFTKADGMPDPSGKNKSFHELIDNERSELARQKGGFGYIGESYEDTANRFANQYGLKTDPTISQIKGFNNKKPADEYLPFVQDFVKSGNWSGVGDLGNTGLIDIQDPHSVLRALGKVSLERNIEQAIQNFNAAVKTAPDAQRYMNINELRDFLGDVAKPEGMAHGGFVSNHFDPIKIKQIIAGLDDEYDPENIQQIIAQRESAYA